VVPILFFFLLFLPPPSPDPRCFFHFKGLISYDSLHAFRWSPHLYFQ
jgi:hypothetical protein